MRRNVKITGVALGSILFLSAIRAEAQADGPKPAGVAREIDAAEVSFMDSLVAVDIQKLEQLLTDDFTWTHTTGGVEMKKEYLKGVQETHRYKGFRREGTAFRIYVKSALSSGVVHITVFMEDGRGGRTLDIRYTAAYVLQNGRWRLAA